MIFLVTDIEFDFTDAFDGEPSEENKKELYDDVLGEWEAHDEEDLTDEISCLLYTSPSPRDATLSRMPSSA